MTITSRMPLSGPQNHMEVSGAPLSMQGMPNSAAISLPQTSTSGAGGLGPTPAPLPTAATTGREDFRGYTTPMPPSPFAMTASLPVLPPVGDGARDSRRQNLQNGRDEPARAEDAIRGGLSRALSGGLSSIVGEEERRRRVEKERDGNARMSGSNLGNRSPDKRLSSGFSIGMGPNIAKGWDDSFQKAFPEANREDGKLSNALGKRERDEEEAGKVEKKKKHHHHHPPQYVSTHVYCSTLEG